MLFIRSLITIRKEKSKTPVFVCKPNSLDPILVTMPSEKKKKKTIVENCTYILPELSFNVHDP